jgi:hypothetical protein
MASKEDGGRGKAGHRRHAANQACEPKENSRPVPVPEVRAI